MCYKVRGVGKVIIRTQSNEDSMFFFYLKKKKKSQLSLGQGTDVFIKLNQNHL